MSFYNKYIRPINHQQIALTKAFVLKIFRQWFDRKNFVNSGKDILVLRLDDKLGDSVTSTGFLAALKKQNPDDKLIVLASSKTKNVYAHLDFIDQVLVAKKGIFGTLFIFILLKFIFHPKPFRWIISTSHLIEPRAIFLAAMLKAQEKIAFQCFEFKLFSKYVQFDENKDHIVYRYQKALNVLSLPASNLNYLLEAPENIKNEVDQSLSRHLQNKNLKITVLNSFAGSGMRSFNEQTTSEIVKKITENPDHLVISIASDGDMEKLKQWQTRANISNWLIYPHLLSFDQNLALLRHAKVVITPDTSIVHMASALRRNVVAVFREDNQQIKNSQIWAPYGTNYRIVYAPIRNPQEPDINSVSVGIIISAWQDLVK